MNNKLNILLFLSIPPPVNGASYANKLLLESRFSKEFKVTHVNCRFAKDNNELTKLTFRKVILFIFYLIQLIRLYISYRFDFVIINLSPKRGSFIKDATYILVSSILFKRKVIVWLHENRFKLLYERSGLLFRKYMRLIFSNCYHLVTVGNYLIEDINFLICRSKINAIHYGLPKPKEFECVRKDRKEKPTNIIYLSHMDITKGWLILIEAAQKICSIRNDVDFNFYGGISGNVTIESVMDRFNNTGFSRRIRYHGPIFGKNKYKILKNADIFCLPTFYDAFPIVNLEAMWAGLPVITTNQGAIPEAIEDGKGGIIVEKENINAIVNAIIRLIENPIERKSMGQYNKKRFKECFTIEAFSACWIDLINNLAMKSHLVK
jgi:glycosyltransferase involved in cell wall biosynthesis